MVSKEEENFLRIVYLHYRVATGALTNFFDKLHPSLSADLNIPGNKAILQDLYIPPPRKKRFLYRSQWDTLYPPPGPTIVTSADLDMTLIVCLLRNIPPLVTEPPTGFDNLPPPHDKSDGANIARLKYHKNFLVSHSKDGTLPDADFVRIWSELEQAITGLDNSLATAASLKDAKTKMLDNSMVQMLSTQIQLVTKVSNFEKELKHISSHIDKDVQEKKQLKQITETLDEKMKIKEDSFEMEYKECKENVDRLSERLDTSEVQMNERVESIEKVLEELQKLQQSLNLQFTRIKTIAIESKSEKEDFVKNVQSLCSLIQVDMTKHEERIAALENSSGTLQEIQRDIDSLKSKLDTLKEEIKKQVGDHIPPHIQAHHRQEVKEWEQDQTTFLETRATRHILESLPLHNCIVVTGSSGCGKTSNIHQAALHLRDSLEYEIIPVLTGPTDIINYYNENKKQVFIVDDICGKETINMQTLQTWRDYSETIEKIFKIAEKNVASKNNKTVSKVSSPKLLLSCRLHIYKEAQFQRITLFTKKECNLLSPELCLLEEERMHMLHKYLPDDIIDSIKEVTENVDYFPLLCKLSKDKTSEEVKKLFTAPLISIKQNINNIIHENKEQFCALVICIVFNDGFDTDWLKLGSVSERKNMKTDKLKYIVKEFDMDLSKQKHRNSIKTAFSTLNGTYLKLRGTEYRMIHDKIYTMAAVICGQHLTEYFIKYAPAILIRDNFIFESVTEVHENDNLIVLLKDEEDDYFERLLCDLTKHVILSTFNNYQLISQTFRHKLISFLKKKKEANTVLMKLDTEGCKTIKHGSLKYTFYQHYYTCYTTPLIESVNTGYFDIIEFLIVNVKCNVNKTDERGNSPLYKASERGHTAVAKLLLENNADVSKCNKSGKSPLYAACKRRYKDTVELLLHSKADLNQLNKSWYSPLNVACKEGYRDIVELLLQSNADVNQCDRYGTSPLFVACEGGHTDIVELLLQNNADVCQCNKSGESPLEAACKGGYEITEELIRQNNYDNGQSPFYAACEGGHTDIVELLLQNNADVNQCKKNSFSPLCVACAGEYTDIVDLLLQNNANVSQCNVYGVSPLFLECKRGHKKTVEKLLNNNADVNQCTADGESPLYVACEGGFTDIVKVLLDNNADVNQCEKQYGRSPLHMACYNDSFSIRRSIEEKSYNYSISDIENFEDTFSKIYASRIKTVQLLLAFNADVRISDEQGQTPLKIAQSIEMHAWLVDVWSV
ncbi:uncharacterized protein LOC134694078 [Mytilus trossulus]|uniref:uncharacterized protein LOC134694078 n=1 Tax=Mytilus trossulus TaxID=6551 RepID=UPI0030046A02